MLSVVTDLKETDLLEARFRQALNVAATERRLARITWRPRTIEVEVAWSAPLGIWWYSEKLTNRWWNVFGIQDPSDGEALRIACEVNFSRGGVNRRIAGLLLQEGTQRFVGHRGNHLGGGKPGITQELFWASRPVVPVDFIDHTGEEPGKVGRAALVAHLQDAHLPEQVATFVKWVAAFKGLADTKPAPAGVPVSTIHTFSPEFEGQRLPVLGVDYVANVNHGRFVRALRDQLSELGVATANTIRWDLYVPSPDGVRWLFELKTGSNAGEVYTGVGQLLFHSTHESMSSNPGLVLAMPAPVDAEAVRRIEQLGIRVLVFDDGPRGVSFQGLEDLAGSMRYDGPST